MWVRRLPHSRQRGRAHFVRSGGDVDEERDAGKVRLLGDAVLVLDVGTEGGVGTEVLEGGGEKQLGSVAVVLLELVFGSLLFKADLACKKIIYDNVLSSVFLYFTFRCKFPIVEYSS